MKKLLSIALFVTTITSFAQVPSYGPRPEAAASDTLAEGSSASFAALPDGYTAELRSVPRMEDSTASGGRYRRELVFDDADLSSVRPDRFDPFGRAAALAFRSNVLLPLMNVGLDIPMGRHYSMGATAYFPWLPPTRNNKYCIQALAFRLDGRFWIGSVGQDLRVTPMTGHSVGVSAFCGKYDLEIAYEGNQGRLLGGDVDWSYAAPLGRNGHWRMTFTLAGGFVYMENRPYDVYEPGGRPTMTSDYVESRTWIGPTRVGVSVSYLILRRAAR